MKITANSSFLDSKTSFGRLSPGVFIGAALLLVSGIAMGNGSTRRQLRELGYNGSYSGVISGNKSFRTTGTGTFTVVPVSQFATERVPSSTRRTVTGYFGTGNSYLLYNKTSVNRHRAIISGLYYGESFNPQVGATTIRTGSKRLVIKRNWRTSTVGLMSLRDNMREYNATGDLLGQWQLRADLSK